MKRMYAITILVLFVFTFTLTYSTCSYAEDTPTAATTLSIQEALDKAYNNNHDLRKAELNLEQSEITRDDTSELINAMYLSGPVSSSEAAKINNAQQANINYNLNLREQKRTKDNITVSVIKAYTSILSSSKQLAAIELQIKEMEQKNKLILQNRVLGLVSDYDVNKNNMSKKQLQEDYTSAKLSYDSAVAALRELVQENDSWNPTLVSQPMLENYVRNALETEISRGILESDLVWKSKAQLDIETGKASWALAGITTQQQTISTSLASVSYEQAKDSVLTQIEQLYYSIDSLESGIRSAQLNYEQAEKNLKMAELKYEVGVLPLISVSDDCLNDYRIAEENAKISLEKQKISLVSSKAEFAYLTAQKVYDVDDWIDN